MIPLARPVVAYQLAVGIMDIPLGIVEEEEPTVLVMDGNTLTANSLNKTKELQLFFNEHND